MSRETWKNRLGFALAAIGSAVGLASIVRFPYLVADYGGAAFIFTYLICLFVIGIPLLISEVTLGRDSQKNCYGAIAEKGKTAAWKASGLWILSTALIVSAFYSALSGWVFGYFVEAVFNRFDALHTTVQATEHFNTLLVNPLWGVGYHFLFLSLSVGIVYVGLRKGIERGCKILMPILFLTLLVLVVKGLSLDHASSALVYLFQPEWSLVTPQVILIALGQAFFTLSLGQGTMITYGSYLSKSSPYIGSCISVALSVVLVSILSAIAVFTIVFSTGVQPEGGLGLLFQTLPVVFNHMAGGSLLAICFFLLVTLAALTSEISALEPVIAYLVDERGWNRKKAALYTGLGALIVGIPCALSTSVLSGWTFSGYNILELFDLAATTVLVPMGALFGVLLVAWRWRNESAFEELRRNRFGIGYKYLNVTLKYVAPVLILVIFLSNFIY